MPPTRSDIPKCGYVRGDRYCLAPAAATVTSPKGNAGACEQHVAAVTRSLGPAARVTWIHNPERPPLIEPGS